MSALVLSSQQNSVVQSMDSVLDQAFGSGVNNSGGQLLAPVDKYNSPQMTQNGNKFQHLLKDTFRSVLSAFICTPGVGDLFTSGTGLTTTIDYKKSNGDTGHLTFTNGVLTSST